MIKKDFGRRYSNCRRRKSSLTDYKLNNVARPVIFSVDCVFNQSKLGGKRCDDFVFCDLNRDQTGIYLIERKTTSGDVGKIKDQLQGGANCIEGFLHDPDYERQRFDFLPVLVSKGIKGSQRKKLRNKKISLRGKEKVIYYLERKKSLPSITAQ